MTVPFRILFDCHSFDTGWQGTTTYLAGVLNALPRVAADLVPDVRLQMICAAHDEDAVRRHVRPDFEFVPIRSGFARRNLLDIPQALRKTGADLVVSQYVRPFHSPCPTVSTIHDVLFLDYPSSFSWSYRVIRRAMFGWSARHSDVVMSVSEYSADRIAHHFGIDRKAIVLTRPAVDPAFMACPTAIRDQARPLRLLSVSRLEQRKRHEWGIAALEMLADAGIDADYTIVGGGEGPYAEALRDQVGQAQARGLKVELKSGVAFADLVAEYSAADIFVFPSEAEGFGIPLLEAAAAGKPCVCSMGGALAEFAGKFAGVGFPADDKTAFLAGVREVATHLDTYSAQAEANRTGIAQSYQWDDVAAAFADVIRRYKKAKP